MDWLGPLQCKQTTDYGVGSLAILASHIPAFCLPSSVHPIETGRDGYTEIQ